MDISMLQGLKPATFEEWAALLVKLREQAQNADILAKAALMHYRSEALRYADSLFEREGLKLGGRIDVLPAWSDGYPYGAEFAGCVWSDFADEVMITGFRLNKTEVRSKPENPYHLGPVGKWRDHVRIVKN